MFMNVIPEDSSATFTTKVSSRVGPSGRSPEDDEQLHETS